MFEKSWQPPHFHEDRPGMQPGNGMENKPLNQLIVIVGASGVGKTTLARVLREKRDFAIAYEQHNERPFQTLFKRDPKYAFANQVDYLLYRAEQERDLRQRDKPALMDGGLDLDFHGFTRLFHTRGWLTDNEFNLCRRFYEHTRALFPAPDLIIALSASAQAISERLAARNRINIASGQDAELLNQFINQWLESIPGSKVIKLDVSGESENYARSISIILDRIRSM